MAYKHGNREQITFLPPVIEDYVSEEDPVRVYDAFIDAIDLKEIGIEIDENAVGNSSYSPRTMLKILVYGYSYGWRSSRKIERALHHNLSFIWLAGGLKPDHKTISNFRKDNKNALKAILKQCARLCLKIGLIEGNTLFVDGSKFRANAGKSQSKSIVTWIKYQKHVEKRINELLEEGERLDACEQESLVRVNKELSSKKRLSTKIDQLLEEIDNEDKSSKSNEKIINGTDPESKIMKGRQGSHSSYNNQMVVDDKNGMIVWIEATTSTNDLNQLDKQITKAEQATGKTSKTVCADAGYSSSSDLKRLVETGKLVIVPNNKQVQKSPKKQFDKQAFKYDKTNQVYICPEGQEMHLIHHDEQSGRYGYRMKNRACCINCKHFGICTSSKTGRRIYRLENEDIKETLATNYQSQTGQDVYQRRKMKVEHPFGHIKRNLGGREFLLRGLEGVNAEINILGACFNITRMISILGGVKPTIQMLKRV